MTIISEGTNQHLVDRKLDLLVSELITALWCISCGNSGNQVWQMLVLGVVWQMMCGGV